MDIDLARKILNENFFTITSESYKSVKSAFYGYALLEDKMLIRSNPDKIVFDKYTAGLFVNIVVDADKILIQQDYFCGYGLFLFRKDKFWAISNSLYLLIEYLSTRFELKINKEYFALYLSSTLCPPALGETIINDISELTHGQFITISSNGELILHVYSYEYASISMFSDAGVSLINAWQKKYENLARFLLFNNYHVMEDLSGGFDTRMLLALLISVIKDKGSIFVNSLHDNFHTHTEDYEIASILAKTYNFSLNLPQQLPGYSIDTQNSILLSMYAKFFMHDQFYYENTVYKNPVFQFGGAGGDILRCYGDASLDEYIKQRTHFTKFDYLDFNPLIEEILKRMFSYIDKHYDYHISLGRKIHYLTRTKNHSLKSALNAFLVNRVFILPLIDPMLSKLDLTDEGINDPKSFLAYIYKKYLPDAVGIKFDGKRSISDAAWKDADNMLNNFNIIPVKQNFEYKIINKSIDTLKNIPNTKFSPKSYIFDLYKTENVKNFICEHFNLSLYHYGFNYAKINDYSSESFMLKLIQLYILNKLINPYNVFPPLPNQYVYRTGTVSKIIDILNTCRIDILNKGTIENKVQIIDSSDKFIYLEYPEYYSSANGNGLVLQSSSNHLKIRLKICGHGILKLIFRCIDYYNCEKKRIQVKIDYINIDIYDVTKSFFVASYNNVIGLSHDKPFVIEIDTNNDDIFDLYITSAPHDYKVEEIDNILKEIYSVVNIQ